MLLHAHMLSFVKVPGCSSYKDLRRCLTEAHTDPRSNMLDKKQVDFEAMVLKNSTHIKLASDFDVDSER